MKNGNRVVATLRRKEALSAEQCRSSQSLIVQIDVLKSLQLTAAFTKAKELFGSIDAVFNNTGIAIITEMESLSYEEVHKVFEANSWDASNVTRRQFRCSRK
ncbi:hypothetical protein BDR05DRAFT_970431 [Suillus weaverae]|nr:hypothetical protein BDR05DRAFT_970431 [Suillus weaverae]